MQIRTYNRQNRHSLHYPDGSILGFSYDTLIFIQLSNGVRFGSSHKYSTTTSKHLNKFISENDGGPVGLKEPKMLSAIAGNVTRFTGPVTGSWTVSSPGAYPGAGIKGQAEEVPTYPGEVY